MVSMFSVRQNIFPASFSVITPQTAREIFVWGEWSVSPYTPSSSTKQLWHHQWSLMCSVCGRDDVKNTSPSFSLVPDRGNGEPPCSPWHWQVLSVLCGTVTEWLCTTLSAEERHSTQILHAQMLLFKTDPQTFHTLRCWELLGEWTQGHGGWQKEGFKALQNGKEFRKGNNFKIILVGNVEVPAHLVPTMLAQDRHQLLLQHSLHCSSAPSAALCVLMA